MDAESHLDAITRQIKKEVVVEVEPYDTDQVMEISDSESTITIEEMSGDDHFDEELFGNQLGAHEELFRNQLVAHEKLFGNQPVADEEFFGNQLVANEELCSSNQNEQSGSSNCVNVVNSDTCDNSDVDGGYPEEEDWIVADKPRAAAVKAAAKIAKSGPKRRLPNNKKNDTTIYFSCGHREQIAGTSLKHIGIKTPLLMKESRLLDERLMKSSDYLLKLPAALTVDQILNDYRRKANLSADVNLTMKYIFTAFNHTLPAWCLFYIEQHQYNEITKKYPNCQLSELYGLTHLFRFIVNLPRLYDKMRPRIAGIHERVTAFMNGLMDYLVEENFRVDIKNDYEEVTPEYLRLTYGPIPNQA